MAPGQNGRIMPPWVRADSFDTALSAISRQIIEALQDAIAADQVTENADLAQKAYEKLQFDFPVWP
jgi:hypothetical protein